jgi:hypothetical protein
MKDWLFLALCLSPFIGAAVFATALLSEWPLIVTAFLAGFTVVGFATPSYYRGLLDIWRHGVHNDR